MIYKHHHSWMVGDGWLWCVQCGAIAPGEGSNWTLPKNAQTVTEILERVAVVNTSEVAIPNPFSQQQLMNQVAEDKLRPQPKDTP